MRDCEIKYLSAARLIELLQLLPSDTRISANAVGNFLVWSADGCEDIGFIDTAHEGEFISFKPDQAAPAPQAAPAWRPIETAPRDGSDVLLFEIYERLPVIGWWCQRQNRWYASTEVYDTDGHATVIDKLYTEGVTHWMPLPAAPQTKEPGNA